MTFSDALTAHNIKKQYDKFTLSIPHLHVPQGFVTALVGENGAGKSTLLSLLAGILLDYQGEIHWFSDPTITVDQAKLRIGYQSTGDYYLPGWTIRQVYEANALLFPDFHAERFDAYVRELDIPVGDAPFKGKKSKAVADLSDGNRIKLILAGLLSRDTDLLLLDEPASPLDPLMREKLCDMLRTYIEAGDGGRSVFFSTHNVADMEAVTDYLMIMENGQIVEEGFVEELKEKYVIVRGDSEDLEAIRGHLISHTASQYGFEGLALAAEAAKLAPGAVLTETPTLTQLCVGVMKQYSAIARG